jgi:hypothetical protein
VVIDLKILSVLMFTPFTCSIQPIYIRDGSHQEKVIST